MSLREVIDCQGCSLRHTIKIHFAKLREKLINRKVLRAVKVESSFAVVKKTFQFFSPSNVYSLFPLKHLMEVLNKNIVFKCLRRCLLLPSYDFTTKANKKVSFNSFCASSAIKECLLKYSYHNILIHID